MKKNRKDTTNVPNLRFPEFSEAWDEKKLSQVSSKIGSGKTPKGGEEVYTSEGIPFIRSQNVINDSLVLDSTHIPQKVHETMTGSMVLPNDILLNITGGSIGRSCVVPKDFIEGNVNQHVSIIRLQNDNPKFLQPILSSWRGQKLVFQGMTGSGREGLNFESIKSFKIYFPLIEEQNKIAAFLQMIEERIQTQNKIIEHQESLMKGLTQQIFTQQIRFKDDDENNFPDWKVKKLSNICDVVKGKQLNREELAKVGTYPAINGGIEPSGYSEEWNTIENTITISEGGNSCGYVNFIRTKFWSGGHCYSLLNIGTEINISFLYQCLKNNQSRIMKLRVGSGLPNIQKGDINNLKIQLPLIEEQTKIAKFLSSLDEKHEKEKMILEQYKQQKKFLLQNLFV